MRVGIVDSGLGDLPAVARASFSVEDGAVVRGAAGPDRVGHGSAVGSVVLHLAPGVELLDAQVFRDRNATTPAAVAAGLLWAVEQGARLVGMSLGLPSDRGVLRDACDAALERGVVLLASSPARGGPVWPAAYDGVIAVSGDARCGPEDISVLPGMFGACPRRLDDPGPQPRAGGASLSVAYALGLLARAGVNSPDQARAHLNAIARFHGRERRTAADA